MVTIDIHAHALIPEAIAAMAASHPDHGPVLVSAGGRRFLEYPGRANLGPLPNAIFDPRIRLADMDRMRVDVQVIAIPPPNFHYHVPQRVGDDFSRIQNDALLGLIDIQPSRFQVFATLPLQDVSASLREIARLVGFPAVRGVQIGTNVNGLDLDHPRFGPIWEAVEAEDLPVWLHPDQRAISGSDRLGEFYLQNLVGLPMETTIAVARLIFGGVLDRHPDLRIGVVHGGGFSPYQVGRWDHGWAVRDEPRGAITALTPGSYFSRLFFDSLTHDGPSLRLLGRRVGWSHVLLGSDYPFDMASEDPVGAVEEVEMSHADRQGVFGSNAERFLRPVRDHVEPEG